MMQPVLVSTLLLSTCLSAAIAFIGQPAKALCIDEDNFTIERGDEERFVSDSPANASTEFKFEVDLGNLTSSGGSDEADAMTSENEPLEAESTPRSESMTDPSATAPAIADFEMGTPSDATALGVMEANEVIPIMSREEYLNQMAENLNECP